MKAVLKFLLTVAAVTGLVYGLSFLPERDRRTTAPWVDDTAGSFVLLDPNSDDSPVTWGTCLPIEVVVDTIDMPDGATAQVEAVVEELVAVTDVNLKYSGTARGVHDRALTPGHYLHDLEQPTIIFGWSDLTSDPPDDLVLGTASNTHRLYDDRSQISGSVITIYSERIVAYAEQSHGGYVERNTYLHEIGHALGLDHVPSPHQIMHKFIGPPVAGLTEGDIDGLNAMAAEMCPAHSSH